MCVNETQYETLENNQLLNCSADDSNHSITINCAVINETFNKSLVSEIAHEVNHLYQYANGLEKNSDLYDKALIVINNDYLSNIGRYVGYAIYYTFKHETDSFATQFYYFIKESDSKCERGFDEMKNEFNAYKATKLCFNSVVKNKSNADVKRALNVIGLPYGKWKMRVENGIKRFDRKLMNVYHRHKIETNRGKTIESIVKRQLSLLERYDTINEGIEPQFII